MWKSQVATLAMLSQELNNQWLLVDNHCLIVVYGLDCKQTLAIRSYHGCPSLFSTKF